MERKITAVAVTFVIALAHGYTGWLLNEQFRHLKRVL